MGRKSGNQIGADAHSGEQLEVLTSRRAPLNRLPERAPYMRHSKRESFLGKSKQMPNNMTSFVFYLSKKKIEQTTKSKSVFSCQGS